MRILLVGGTGVLSSAVTTEALKRGINVTMINRGRRPIPDGVELIKADKDDIKTIEASLKERVFDAVMDFLCLTDIQTERSIKLYSKYTNQYFYISSCAVYNTEQLAGKEGDENSPKVLPIWDYSVGKWKSEELVMSLFKGSDVNYTIIRPCVTYDNTRIPYGISPMYGFHWTLCSRILSGKPIITWNGGNNRCNMLRVEDFAVGVVGLIGNPQAYNEAFNICGDETPSWNEVLDTMSDLLGKKVIKVDIPSEFYAEHFPTKKGEILGGRSIDSINSNIKIKLAVPDYKQNIFLREGISKTIDAYKQTGYQKGIDWEFDACTDRIIGLYLKKNRQSRKLYKISFSNYLGSATLGDRIIYMCYRYGSNRVLTQFITRVVRKLRSTLG